MISPARLLAISAIGLGSCWLVMISRVVLRAVSDTPTGALLWFGAFIIPIMMIPGAVALYLGCGLFREVTPGRITGALGVCCLFAGSLLTAIIGSWGGFLPKAGGFVPLLLAVLAMVPIYLFLGRKIIRAENLEENGRNPSLDLGTIRFLAILIWLILSGWAHDETGSVGGYLEKLGMAGNFLRVILPILAAWGFYRIAARVFPGNNPQLRKLKSDR